MAKSGEIIIFAQAKAQVEQDVGLLVTSVIEKYGLEAYTQLLIDMGQNVFIGLLSGEFDIDDDDIYEDDL